MSTLAAGEEGVHALDVAVGEGFHSVLATSMVVKQQQNNNKNIIKLICIFLLLSTCKSTLVGHWKGENSTNSNVDNSGGFDLTDTKSISFAPSKVNLGFDFNQEDEYARKTIGNVDLPTNSFSIAFWINSASTDGEIFTYKDLNQYTYSVNLMSGKYLVKVKSTTKTFSKILNTYSQWNHIAVTWSTNGDLKFYQNGALTNQETGFSTSTIFKTNGTIYLGSSGSASFLGKIDEIMLWNTVRSRDDILTELGTFCNYIEKSDPSVCSGKGKCISHNKCSCYSGNFGNYCQNEASRTTCQWKDVSKLKTDYYPVIDSQKTTYLNDTLNVVIETPLVNNRYNTKIFIQNSDEYSISSYPGKFWTHSLKNTGECKNVYSLSIPWVIGKNSGWDKKIIGDDIVYSGNIYIHEKEVVGNFRGVAVTRNIRSVISLLIKFRFRISLSTEVSVTSPVALIAALTKQEFIPGNPTIQTPNSGILELATSVGNPYTLRSCEVIETPLPITASISKSIKTQPCINGLPCLQYWDLPLTVNNACSFTGRYKLKCKITCQEELKLSDLPTNVIPVVSNTGLVEINQGKENITIPETTILSGSFIPGYESWPIEIKEVNCPNTGDYCTSLENPIISNGNVIVQVTDKTTCQTTKFRFTAQVKGRPNQVVSGDFYIKYKNCQCSDPIDICFVYDGSGSISRSHWNTLKSFGHSLLTKLTVDQNNVHVGIVQFSKYVRTEIGLSYNQEAISNALTAMTQYRSMTNTKAGIERCNSILSGSTRPSADKVIVILTDGEANYPCGSGCSWNPWQGQFCDACVSPIPLTNQINARKKLTGSQANWKVVALGIGSGLSRYNGYGASMVKQMNSNQNITHLVQWNDLSTVASYITDESCDTHSMSNNVGNSGLLNAPIAIKQSDDVTVVDNRKNNIDLFEGINNIDAFVPGCPYVNEDGEAIITIDINSENFCEKVTLDIKLQGSMKSYEDKGYTLEKNSFISNSFAYFKTNVVSTQATIFKSTVIRTEIFDGNKTKVLLDNSLSGGITDFGKNLSYVTDTSITVGTEAGFYFKFQDPFIKIAEDASADFKVTATVEVEYTAIVQDTLNNFPLSMRELKKKIMKYHFTKDDILDSAQKKSDGAQDGKYAKDLKFTYKSSSLKMKISQLLLFALLLIFIRF